MAEYIERKAVEETMQKHRCSDCTSEKSLDCPLCQLHRPFDEISKLPTADVVPKSEVEELIKSVDDMLDLVCAMTGLELTYYGKYAELKKKYTEDKKECPNCRYFVGCEKAIWIRGCDEYTEVKNDT